MSTEMRGLDRKHRRRFGFTLIEIVAVIVIIAILIVMLVPQLVKGRSTVETGNTRSFLAQLTAKIGEYEQEAGDWPPSTAPAGMDLPNKVNLGAELLVVSLFAPNRPDPGISEDRLGNSDGDSARKSLTSFPLAALYELVDDWGNPIAYIHRSDYDEVFEYQTIAADETPWVQSVRAKKNPRTETYYNHTGFQLLSAGSDGEFGTDDDVANYEQEK